MGDEPDWAEDLAAMETAARDAGIVPGDPGYAFVCGLARTLDHFGRRLNSLLQPTRVTPQELADAYLTKAASQAVSKSVLSIMQFRYYRMLVWMSTIWALTMVIAIGATYYVGYAAGSSRRALSFCTSGSVVLDTETGRRYCTFSAWVD